MLMKKVEYDLDDDLRPEYELKSLRVRKFGPKRTKFGEQVVQFAPDVAEVFPDSASVNEALRFLIRITRANRSSLTDQGSGDAPIGEAQTSSELP